MTAIAEVIRSLSETQDVLNLLGLNDHAKLLDAPITKLTEMTPTAAATAADWEVSHVDDRAGRWTYLQVYDPARDGEDEQGAPIACISLSDYEAGVLAKELTDRTDVEVQGVPDE